MWTGENIEYTDDLPMDDYYETIEKHFYLRTAARELSSQLNDRSHQFRLIQKRLLQRFKDKNPSPLNSMDVLLKETYEDIMSISARLQQLHAAQRDALEQLQARSRLIALLVTLKFRHLTPADRVVLENHLCPLTQEGMCEDSHGWEETVDASLTYLLKTVLAKNAKDAATLPDTLEVPQSCERLRKHIAIVVDRLGKGSSLSSTSGGVAHTGGGSGAAESGKEGKYGGAAEERRSERGRNDGGGGGKYDGGKEAGRL